MIVTMDGFLVDPGGSVLPVKQLRFKQEWDL